MFHTSHAVWPSHGGGRTWMWAISLCSLTRDLPGRAAAGYHCRTLCRDADPAWDAFSLLVSVARSSCTCCSWLCKVVICCRRSCTETVTVLPGHRMAWEAPYAEQGPAGSSSLQQRRLKCKRGHLTLEQGHPSWGLVTSHQLITQNLVLHVLLLKDT